VARRADVNYIDETTWVRNGAVLWVWTMVSATVAFFMIHPPNVGQWRAFYARLSRLINRHHDRKDEAGKLARSLLREMDSLWLFLEVRGVEPTNNRAERALRFGVMRRKPSYGTDSEKGDRWVERILTVRQTCRLRGRPTFPVLVEAVKATSKALPQTSNGSPSNDDHRRRPP